MPAGTRNPFRMAVPLLALTLGVARTAEPAAAGGERQVLWDPAAAPATWARRSCPPDAPAKLEPVPVVAFPDPSRPGEKWNDLTVTLPGDNEFVMPLPAGMAGWQRLALELLIPADAPATADLYVFTKDWDYLWRQVRMPLPTVRGTPTVVEIPVNGLAAETLWTPCDHQRPWHVLTAGQVREVGVKVALRTGAIDTFSGHLLLGRVWLQERIVPAQEPLAIRSLGFTPDEPAVGSRCEFTLDLDAYYQDPFAADQVAVEVTVTTPDGRREAVPGFYDEDFCFAGGDVSAPPVPVGRPRFRARYTPRVQGPHTAAVSVHVGERVITAPAMAFQARPPAPGYKGFVRVDEKDRRFFSHDGGEVFSGIGLNVRSPFDTRYIATVPYSAWRDEGLGLYRRLFEIYQRNGINVIEVWMCSWWLALEWINDAPGNHGVGYMNPYRAWMLDRIVDWAEEHDVYLFVVFNNHGKFGALNDTEWARNPFNTKNGGYLESCEEYFTDARAQAAFRRFADYTLARWSASPNVLAWKLFTEIDLTGTTYDFYYKPAVSEWHKGAAAYVKQRDLYKHMITTHWMISYQRMNDAVADLPELDILTTDAYYLQGSTREMLELLRGTAAYASGKNKPVLVTEFGGSPHADSMGNLTKQAHLGAWTGFFCGSPMTPMFWWFALVDEHGLYDSYRVLAQFTRGEDRRGLKPTVQDLSESAGLYLNFLRDAKTILVWGFDTRYYLVSDENVNPRLVRDFPLTFSDLAAGTYEVEFWDVAAGTPTGTTTLTVTAGTSVGIPIPPFEREFALKIRLRP